MHRPRIVALIAASLVAVAGCSSARKVATATAQPADPAAKKEYQSKDLGGSGLYRQPIRPTPEG